MARRRKSCPTRHNQCTPHWESPVYSIKLPAASRWAARWPTRNAIVPAMSLDLDIWPFDLCSLSLFREINTLTTKSEMSIRRSSALARCTVYSKLTTWPWPLTFQLCYVLRHSWIVTAKCDDSKVKITLRSRSQCYPSVCDNEWNVSLLIAVIRLCNWTGPV